MNGFLVWLCKSSPADCRLGTTSISDLDREGKPSRKKLASSTNRAQTLAHRRQGFTRASCMQPGDDGVALLSTTIYVRRT